MKLMRYVTILGCVGLALCGATTGFSVPAGPMAEAETLLQSPTLDLAKAEKALKLYECLLSAHEVPRPSLLAQLARTCYILGDLAPKKYSDGYYCKGKIYAETLINEEPNRVEGHYWLALNLCGQAEAGGYMVGRRLLPRILEELNQAVILDAGYDQAGAHRVLGRIYFEAPAWPMSVGDLQKSMTHLQAAVHLAPHNSTNHLFLAQTLYRLHYASLAHQQLEQVLKCTHYAIKPQDLEEDKQEARRLLADMSSEKAP
jgi:hypothetical protein